MASPFLQTDTKFAADIFLRELRLIIAQISYLSILTADTQTLDLFVNGRINIFYNYTGIFDEKEK